MTEDAFTYKGAMLILTLALTTLCSNLLMNYAKNEEVALHVFQQAGCTVKARNQDASN